MFFKEPLTECVFCGIAVKNLLSTFIFKSVPWSQSCKSLKLFVQGAWRRCCWRATRSQRFLQSWVCTHTHTHTHAHTDALTHTHTHTHRERQTHTHTLTHAHTHTHARTHTHTLTHSHTHARTHAHTHSLTHTQTHTHTHTRDVEFVQKLSSHCRLKWPKSNLFESGPGHFHMWS